MSTRVDRAEDEDGSHKGGRAGALYRAEPHEMGQVWLFHV